MLKIYMARSMTGRIKEDVVKEAHADKTVLEMAGIEALCPVSAENIEPSKQLLLSSKKAMDEYWPRDKQMIEKSHVLFDMSPQMKSEGVSHEIGYARYFLYRPVVRVYKDGKLPSKSSVSYYEDDFLASSLNEAIEYAKKYHGTWRKRIKWRASLYNRCLIKMIRCWCTSWK